MRFARKIFGAVSEVRAISTHDEASTELGDGPTTLSIHLQPSMFIFASFSYKNKAHNVTNSFTCFFTFPVCLSLARCGNSFKLQLRPNPQHSQHSRKQFSHSRETTICVRQKQSERWVQPSRMADIQLPFDSMTYVCHSTIEPLEKVINRMSLFGETLKQLP